MIDIDKWEKSIKFVLVLTCLVCACVVDVFRVVFPSKRIYLIADGRI